MGVYCANCGSCSPFVGRACYRAATAANLPSILGREFQQTITRPVRLDHRDVAVEGGLLIAAVKSTQRAPHLIHRNESEQALLTHPGR